MMTEAAFSAVLRQAWGFVGKVVFIGGFAMTPIAMGSLIRDVDSWGGVYGWLVRAWDNGFRQPVLTLINPIVGWIGLSIPASVIDYLTIGGIVVAAHLRTIRAFPYVRDRMILPWAKPDLPSSIRWPVGIALWPVTFGLFYVVLAISLMLLFLSDGLLGEGQGSNAGRKDIFKTIAAASAFLIALSLPFILMAIDAQSGG